MTFFVEGLTGFGGADGRTRRIGEFETLAGAIAAARRAIDEYLTHEFKPGMLPSALFEKYQSAGEAAFIFRDNDTTVDSAVFNHHRYARDRCIDLCRR
jgi:hypothetical protein